ncbi:MAG: OmpA family protein [Deltaproteobacteria bacterium]|nr:OmpA family protein [Deltaproteobacteria bacterium]
MKRIFFIVLCAAISASGCNKKQTNVASADDAITVTPQSDGNGGNDAAVASPSIQAAEGELKELLLVLQRVHFPLDASTLTEPAKAALVDASNRLKEMTDITLAVEGHTDSRGTNEYNMSLAERRAQTVVKYLSNLGVDESRLAIASFGEENPMADGSGDVVNAKNRRVDFRLKQGNIEFVLEEGALVDDDGNPIQ